MIKRVILTSFALCSIYFGSGNVVFPLLIGVQAQSYYLWAILGWNITAVMIPLVGMVAVVRFQCSALNYFSHFGKWIALGIMFLFMGLLGPFGIIPRCIGLSLGTVQTGLMDVHPAIFNACFSFAIIMIVVRPEKAMHNLATIVTPFKIGSLVLLMGGGMYLTYGGDGGYISNPLGMVANSPWEAFLSGVYQGYNTLDLIGSFFFARIVTQYLKESWTSKEDFTPQLAFKYLSICAIGAGILLSSIYFSITYLSAVHGGELINVQPRMLLAALSTILFGAWGAPITAFVVTITCLSTASILLLGWSNLIQEQLTTHYSIKFQSRSILMRIIIISAGIAYLISLLGFEEIVSYLGALMYYIYPFLILDVFYSFFRKASWKDGDVSKYFEKQGASL